MLFRSSLAREHERIIEAIAAHDSEAAMRLIREHIENQKQAIDREIQDSDDEKLR